MSSQLHDSDMMDARGALGEDRLAPVLFARNREEATRFCALLDEVDIPALVGDHTGVALKGIGVPILVPESLHEWSSEILAAAEPAYADHDFEDDDEDDDEDDEDDDFFPDDDDDDLDDDGFLDDDFDHG